MWRNFYLFVFILLLFTESMITKYVCTYFTSKIIITILDLLYIDISHNLTLIKQYQIWKKIYKKSWWKLSIIYKLCIFDVNVFSLSRDDDHWHPKHDYTIEQDYSAEKFKRSRTSLSRKGKQKIRKTNRPFRRKRFVLKFNLRESGRNVSKSIYWRVWRYQRGYRNPYIKEEQAIQWPK